MRNLLLILFFLVSTFLFGQSPDLLKRMDAYQGKWEFDSINNEVKIVDVVDFAEMTPDQLYLQTYKYWADHYLKTGKFLTESKETGIFIFEGVFVDVAESHSMDGKVTVNLPYKIKFETKQGKYRYSIICSKLWTGKMNPDNHICLEQNRSDIELNSLYPINKTAKQRTRNIDIKTLLVVFDFVKSQTDKLKSSANTAPDNW